MSYYIQHKEYIFEGQQASKRVMDIKVYVPNTLNTLLKHNDRPIDI